MEAGPACHFCDGSGCYRCQTTKKCIGCSGILRIGCFDGEKCRACVRKAGKTYKKALNDIVQEVTLPASEDDIDLDQYINNNEGEINNVVSDAIQQHRAIRVYVSVDALLSREGESGPQICNFRFQTPIQLVGGGLHDLDIDEFRRSLHDSLDRFTNLGSGYTLQRVLKFVVHLFKYRPLVGSSYIPTPPELVSKHALVNPRNKDNECFKWAVLAALFPVEENTHRVSSYKPHVNKVDWSSLKFPVSLRQIREFERRNTDLTINVYEYVEEEVTPTFRKDGTRNDDGNPVETKTVKDIIPIHVTKNDARKHHVNLLLLTDGENHHYCWIKNMSRLVAHRTHRNGTTFVCAHCCHPYTNEVAFNNHFPACSKNLRQVTRFPCEETVKFTQLYAVEKHPFVIYADLECCLKPTEEEQVGTYALSTHEPSGFCIYIQCHNSPSISVSQLFIAVKMPWKNFTMLC